LRTGADPVEDSGEYILMIVDVQPLTGDGFLDSGQNVFVIFKLLSVEHLELDQKVVTFLVTWGKSSKRVLKKTLELFIKWDVLSGSEWSPIRARH